MKKIFLTLLALFLLSLVIELLCGTGLWLKSRFANTLETGGTIDAPYLYWRSPENAMNEDGLEVSKQYSIAKPAGTYRIILVGGSVARYLGAYVDASGQGMLEKKLQELLGNKKIEVINAGKSAYTTEQEFLLTQLYLQKYQPDMIIGLNGYNDLLSYQFNRFDNNEHQMLLPPITYSNNYAGDFRVLKLNEKMNDRSFLNIFSGLYKNTGTMMRSLVTRMKKNPYASFENISDTVQQPYATWHVKLVTDLHDYCKAKNIRYVNFLQPVKYYPATGNEDETTKALSSMYNLFEKDLSVLPYQYSLTGIMKDKSVYTDDCHVNETGNSIFVDTIAQTLTNILKTDTVYTAQKP